MNKQFDELIDKHLKGTLAEHEKRLLSVMLRVPENQLYLASKIDEQFLDEVVTEVGDEAIRDQVFSGIQHRLNETTEQETYQYPGEVVQMSWYRRRGIRVIAVAASVILMVSLAMVFFMNSNKSTVPSLTEKTTQPLDSTVSVVRHRVNTTGKEMRIQLSDSSLIVLADKSEISYREPFMERRVTLTGKAYFKVAKDKNRPFTVISGDISTTALGTEFTVTSFGNSNEIIVRLYEGKVVVRAVDKSNRILKKDVYLLPGQAFVYNDHATADVKTFKIQNAAAPEKIINDELVRDNPSIPENAEVPYFMFNNNALGEVFEQLAKMYQVKIIYDQKDVQNIYFTRKYNSSDSIENILKEIASLNNLRVSRKDNTFTISR